MQDTPPRNMRELLRYFREQNITGYRRYKLTKRFLDEKARIRGVPISGAFELTPLCNLDCRMCYVHLNRAQMQGAPLLATEQWKDIMKQAVNAGMMYARLTGGECMTYPGFKELYLYLRSMGVEVALMTNGTLLSKEMLSFLRDNKPAAIQITLYGASEEGYERVTGQRMFETVMKNIRAILDADIPLALVMTPNEFMTDGDEILRLMHSLHLPLTINAGLMAPREETGRAIHEAELDTYISLIRLKQALTGEGVSPECEMEDLPQSGGSAEAVFGVRCGAGRSNFAVNWRGNMTPCLNFPQGEENILELGFAEAWRRTHAAATNYPLPVECEGCGYQKVCKHCVAEHAAGAPAGHASPNICAWGRRMVAEGILSLPQPR